MPARIGQPRYMQLFEEIRGRIENGEYPIGERLPSQQELAKEFGVAFMTIRRTVEELIRAGYVSVRHGAGTFASSPNQPAILLVDDEPALRSVVRLMLQEEGWSVAEASEGEEALQMIRTGSFTYLMTDIRMPNGMGGLDLIRTVHRQRPTMTIIVATSYPEDLMALDQINAWPLTIMRKPIRAEALRRALQSIRPNGTMAMK